MSGSADGSGGRRRTVSRSPARQRGRHDPRRTGFGTKRSHALANVATDWLARILAVQPGEGKTLTILILPT
jgi:hypothetical protein